MTWLVAGAAVAAVCCFVAGVVTRHDPLLRARLVGSSPGIRSPLVSIGRVVRSRRMRASVSARLEAAGGSAEDVDRVLGQKVCLASVGGAGWVVLVRGGALDPTTIVGGALVITAGFLGPEFRMSRRSRSMRERAAASVADLLDLVAVSVTAGLTPRLALERAPDALGGPLGEEVARARQAVALGTPWRAVVRRVAERTGIPELRRLAVTLERSERLGTPVAERLRDLAREVRAERAARQEERARRAPVAMLFPLVFLILPAFVIAAVVPALLVATGGLP
jgi:Flp pilus assembly protein TadB